MADDEDSSPPKRKWAPGNTAPDGSFIVGHKRTPEHGKFRKNDGRKRGRRPKGTRNLATDFNHEMQQFVTVTVNGQPRRVSKQQSLVMRLIDNASRGQNSAIKMVFEYEGKFGIVPPEEAQEASSTDTFPRLQDLSADEFAQLDLLLSKAMGIEPVERAPDPFAYLSDPEHPRNMVTERTVDGLLYNRTSLPGHRDQLTAIENRAYYSAALPRRAGCNRRSF